MRRLSTKKNEIRANISLGGVGFPYEPSETEIRMAKKAAKSLGLSVAGVDIIPSGKKRLVIEVNSSPGLMIEEITKTNIAKKMVRLAVSGARKGNKPVAQKIVDALSADIPIPIIKPKSAAQIKSMRPLKKIFPKPSSQKTKH